MAERRESWAVVGGGVLGMELASRLSSGRDVTIIESAPELGGLASTWDIGGVRWDRHYHVVLPTDDRTLRLLDRIGLTGQVRWHAVPAGCESEGRIHSATTPGEILALPFLGWLAKLRLGLTAVRASVLRNPLDLEDVPATTWLRRWSGAEATTRFWEPLLRSKLGRNVDLASAVFIATTLRRLTTARRKGGSAGDGFGFVSGGYATVLARMAATLHDSGVHTRLGARITLVEKGPLGLTVTSEDGSSETYDNVVVTAASPLAARMCPDLAEDERALCAGVTYQGIVCLSLLLTGPLTENYITYLLSPQPFTALIDMSALVGADQLDGHGLVYLPSYVRSDDPLLAADDAQIIESFIKGLTSLYPDVEASIVAARVSKVRQVLPVPTLGYSTRLPPVRTSVPGLFLVSSALITDGTLNVNETLGVAERAFPLMVQQP